LRGGGKKKTKELFTKVKLGEARIAVKDFNDAKKKTEVGKLGKAQKTINEPEANLSEEENKKKTGGKEDRKESSERNLP